MTPLRLLIGALVAVTMLGACSHGTTSPAPAAAAPASPTASVTPTASDYASSVELREALLAAGVPCGEPETISHDGGVAPPGVIGDSISCTGYADELDLDVYESQDGADGRPDYQSALLSGLGVGSDAWFVIGSRWTVQCTSHDDALKVVGALGGHIEQ